MSMEIGGIVSGGTAGSVLFVADSGGSKVLAQDNANFFWDDTGNVLKSANAGSGANSGNFNVSTGAGGPGSSGAPPAGNSGNLLLTTGQGGNDAFGTAGSGGSIIIQPGTSGGGSGGTGGTVIVRAPANHAGNFFAVQNDTGATTYWGVTNASVPGTLTGTRPLSISHSSTGVAKALSVTGTGAKTDHFTAAEILASATSSTADKIKTALSIQATNTWNGTAAVARALHCGAAGGTNNYAAIFEAGNVGVNVTDPSARLHIAAGSAGVGGAALKFNSGTLLGTPEAGALEWNGSEFYRTNATARRPLETSLEIANVLDFGAKGDGSTDDSAAFQAAVDSLELTGGIVWVPPGRKYVVAEVTITAKYAVWIISEMDGHAPPGGYPDTYNDSASITPKPGGTITHIFKWAKHSDFENAGYGAGGGIRGLLITEIRRVPPVPPDPGHTVGRETPISTGAIWIEDATEFRVENCLLFWLKGTAIKVGKTTYTLIRATRINSNGGNNTPIVDIGGVGANSYVWTERVFMEVNLDTHIRVGAGGQLEHHNSYHESSFADGPVYIDASTSSSDCTIDGCEFNVGDGTNIILGSDNRSIVRNCRFWSWLESDDPYISVLAPNAQLLNLYFLGEGIDRTLINCANHYCQISNIYCKLAGKINVTGTACNISNVYMYQPAVSAGDYCIDFNSTFFGTLNGGVIDGVGVSVCHGVRVSNGTITGVRVRRLASTAYAIVSTAAENDTIVGCAVTELASGTPFIYTNGTRAWGNLGFTKTAAASSGAATLNAECGSITTDALTTVAGASYNLALTNSCIKDNSQVLASCDFGTGGANQGTPMIGYCIAGNGVVNIGLYNMHASQAFGGGDGKYRIHFKIVN